MVFEGWATEPDPDCRNPDDCYSHFLFRRWSSQTDLPAEKMKWNLALKFWPFLLNTRGRMKYMAFNSLTSSLSTHSILFYLQNILLFCININCDMWTGEITKVFIIIIIINSKKDNKVKFDIWPFSREI